MPVYFVALGLLVTIVAGAAAVYVYLQSADDARRAATADASFAAHKAAADLSSSLAFIDKTVGPLASGPTGLQILAHPEACTLGYAPIGTFVTGHIDVLNTDGTVICTSRTSGRGEPTYAGQPWLDATNSIVTAPFTDPATGAKVVVVVYPIAGKGFFTWFVDLAPIGPRLADVFGSGVDDLEFMVTTADGSSAVTRSVDSSKWSGARLKDTSFATGSGVDRTDVSGTPRLYGEATVTRAGWKVYVGASQAIALASAAQLQQRQVLIIVIGLVAVLLGMLYAYRSVAVPVAALNRAVRASHNLDGNARVPVSGPREVAFLGQEINDLVESLNSQWAEREEAQRTYLKLFEGNPLPIVVSDQNGEFIDLNEAAQKAFGYNRSEFMTLGRSDLYMPADDEEAAQVAELNARLAATSVGSVKHGPISLRKKDGAMLRATGTTYKVEYLGKQAWVAMLEDVTLTERLQRQIKQTERLEALGQLAGGIAHDFNNLLAVILTVTDSLKSTVGGHGDATERDLDRVDKAARTAATLTRQLLSFARREALTGAPLDMSEQIGGLTELLRRTLGSHVVLTATLPDGLWSVVMEPAHLHQIVINLAVNARDAMGKGGQLAISTENFKVDPGFVESHPNLSPGRYVRLQVSDSGSGMDQATLDRLFEPFFTTKPAGHGTGLGLATVYGIVKQLHGDISVYSEVGRGSTFTILLPASEAAVPKPVDVSPPSAPLRGSGTVLVVEDYSDLRELFGEILEGAGYTVITASDGQAGLKVAHEHEGEIDVLLTDIVMPNMLGSDLAAQLKREYPGLRVIYMSGHAQPVLGGAVTLEPGTPLLQKPFMESELLEKIEEVLSRPAVPV